LRSVGPTAQEVARLDADLSRATWDPDGCCAFRKVAPLQRALAGYDAWISGRKRFQASTRLDLPVFETDDSHVKVNPLASWSANDISTYVARHRLPPHPWWRKAIFRSAARPARRSCPRARIRAPAAGADSTRPNAASTDPPRRKAEQPMSPPVAATRAANKKPPISSPSLSPHLQRWRTRRSISCARSWPSSRRPVMLYSVGKDSSVMLHLARKAFYPAPPPFPFLHIASGWDFRA
jgi:3'-phosphoadenosine 5'-phosphosulfate sulfotransferase (PAPS reductase)/FAD synthetase